MNPQLTITLSAGGYERVFEQDLNWLKSEEHISRALDAIGEAAMKAAVRAANDAIKGLNAATGLDDEP